MKILISSLLRHCNNGLSKHIRFFSLASSAPESQQPAPSVDKNLLMKLRRKTGYSFVNCKKALLEYGEDLESAEKWLHELARKEGWQKATKLQSRSAKQGLIGVIARGSLGTVVEVNCETDFVSRNQKFQELVKLVAETSFKLGQSKLQNSSLEDLPIDSADLLTSQIPDGSETVGDKLTFTLSQLGEKLEICRSICLGGSDPNVQVFGYVHPSQELGKQLCQHIVGMNPEKVGTMPALDEQSSDSDGETEPEAQTDPEKSDAGGITDELEAKETREAEEDVTSLGDEKEMLRQEFLLHPDITVGEYVRGHGATVLDFVRFESGETSRD